MRPPASTTSFSGKRAGRLGGRRKCHNAEVLTIEHRVRQDDQSVSAGSRDRREGTLKVVRSWHLHEVNLYAKRLRSRFRLLDRGGETRV
jgi:hypothetical protein